MFKPHMLGLAALVTMTVGMIAAIAIGNEYGAVIALAGGGLAWIPLNAAIHAAWTDGFETGRAGIWKGKL